MLLTILLVLLLLGLFGGYWGNGRGYGYYGWSPAALVFVLIVLALVLHW